MIDVIFFSSPIGLGHATRDAAIVELFENISTKFITGSGAAKLLLESGFEVQDAYNPPKFDVQNGILRSSSKWLWKYYQYYKECKNISSKIIEEQKPNLVVSDEDFASLSVAQKKKIPTVLITDILETHFTTGFTGMVEKRMNKSMKDIMDKCDLVIIPEEGIDEKNIMRVGPIVRQTNKTRDKLRKEWGFTKATILISVGGTDAGKFLIEKTLNSILKISNDVDVVIVSGPSLQTKFNNARNLGFVKNLHEVIFASDVVISLAGKSTIDEAKAYGTPGIFIPIKDHFEQEDNAREIGFQFNDINRLEVLIEQKLSEKRQSVKADGVIRASNLISKLLK